MFTKKKFLLISLYVVFLVLLFEGSARLAFKIPQVKKTLFVGDELGWRRWWVNRHKYTGKEIYYKFDIYDRTKGWVSKPNLKDMTVFDDKILNTNSKGLRGKNEYLYGKNQNKIRILVLGDSFTFGDEVSDNETYSYYLQEMMPQSEVINLGMHGYGHDQMLTLFKEEGIKYKPDIVILGFLPMDMSRNLLNFRDYAKPKFVLDNNKLRLTANHVPSPEETMQWDWARPRLFDIFSIVRHKLNIMSGSHTRKANNITTAILTEIIELTDSIDAIPMFAYLPDVYANEIKDVTTFTSGENYLFGMCQTNDKVRCFSTRSSFAEKLAKGVTFKKFGHWGPAGHLAIAEAIKHYLVNNEGYVALRNSLEMSDISKPNKTAIPSQNSGH